MADGEQKKIHMPLWSIIVLVVIMAVSFMGNTAQAIITSQIQEVKERTRKQEVRIRENSEALTELRFIRGQLNRIESQIEELRKEQ